MKLKHTARTELKSTAHLWLEKQFAENNFLPTYTEICSTYTTEKLDLLELPGNSRVKKKNNKVHQNSTQDFILNTNTSTYAPAMMKVFSPKLLGYHYVSLACTRG